jgi:GNAT superfamily N-acetyltransferase
MLEIKEITTPAQLEETTAIVRAAFDTVAKEMGLTLENAPSHPAFTTMERMSAIQLRMPFFGLYLDGLQVGCAAVEKASDSVFYLERLAVLPVHWHKGYGKWLIDFVMGYAKERGGKKVSLGMINSYIILKDWYKSLGFVETGTKQFEGLPFVVCFMDKEISA